VQSRKSIISTKTKDNAGCAVDAESKEFELTQMTKKLAEFWGVDLNKHIITVYYEWAGGNIQKNSALTNLPKMGIIFKHFKVSPIIPKIGLDGQEKSSFWLPTKIDTWIENKEIGFYNVMNFPILKVDFDFNNLKETNDSIVDKIIELEKNSKVGEALGVKENVGEGYVGTIDFNKIIVDDNEISINGILSKEFSDDLYREIKVQLGNGVHFPKLVDNNDDSFSFEFDILKLSNNLVIELMKLSNRFAFKFKGEEHSNNTKVKSLEKVNSELENKKIDFVEKFACTQSRLEQFYDETEAEYGSMSMELTSIFIRKVHADVMAEETENMSEFGLVIKDINKYMSTAILNYMRARMKKELK